MNHYKEVFKIINSKEGIASSEKYNAGLNILKHFVELTGEKDFNLKFEYYFINNDDSETFDECYYDFHKSMCQTDFYSDCYLHVYGRNEQGKRTTEYENIGGHLDMLFWNFIHISEIPHDMLKIHYNNYKACEEFIPNIGKKVVKCSITEQEENGKKFLSGLVENSVKGLTIHPFLEIPAYTFVEDDSYVECRRCKVVEIAVVVEEKKNLGFNMRNFVQWKPQLKHSNFRLMKKPTGAVIRLNDENGCIVRICGVPKEVVFEPNGEVKPYIDITYPKK